MNFFFRNLSGIAVFDNPADRRQIGFLSQKLHLNSSLLKDCFKVIEQNLQYGDGEIRYLFIFLHPHQEFLEKRYNVFTKIFDEYPIVLSLDDDDANV